MSNKSFSFGDPVTNICSGEDNPQRHAYFVRKKSKGNIEVTDKLGRFWIVSTEVVEPGHLSSYEAHRLFQPIWQKRYGKIAQQEPKK